MTSDTSETIHPKTPVNNSLEELAKYLRLQQINDAKKWGKLYPFKIAFNPFKSRTKKIIMQVLFALQRLFRNHHCSNKDLRSLDLHIATILLPKLEAFRKQNLRTSPTGEMGSWLKTLDEIIYAFRWNIYANWEINPRRERNFYLYYFDEDDPDLNYFHYDDSVLVKKAAARAQKGFELFGKYFTGLYNY